VYGDGDRADEAMMALAVELETAVYCVATYRQSVLSNQSVGVCVPSSCNGTELMKLSPGLVRFQSNPIQSKHQSKHQSNHQFNHQFNHQSNPIINPIINPIQSNHLTKS